MIPISENGSEAICGRDASRTDTHGRKIPLSVLKNRINTWRVTQANREM